MCTDFFDMFHKQMLIYKYIVFGQLFVKDWVNYKQYLNSWRTSLVRLSCKRWQSSFNNWTVLINPTWIHSWAKTKIPEEENQSVKPLSINVVKLSIGLNHPLPPPRVYGDLTTILWTAQIPSPCVPNITF